MSLLFDLLPACIKHNETNNFYSVFVKFLTITIARRLSHEFIVLFPNRTSLTLHLVLDEYSNPSLRANISVVFVSIPAKQVEAAVPL